MPRRIILIFSAAAVLLSGCATAPMIRDIAIYDINGAGYFSLASFCRSNNVAFDYDTFTRTAALSKGTHKVNLMAGQNLVLLDGKPQHLKYSVDIYHGALVAPYKLKEQLDNLFKEAFPAGEGGKISLRIKKVVIDAGHGGTDPGTIGRTGVKEKDVNLDVALRLSRILTANGIEVVLTRSNDKFISLAERVEIANKSGAGLFVSIHSNANRVRSLRGFEVYCITSNIKSDCQRALTAAQSADLKLDGSYFAAASLDVKATLWDMINTFNRAESMGLARHLCNAVGNNLEEKALGTKDANFYVLKGTHMPAVLAEIGFLSNAAEELRLKNAYYRQQIAEAIAQGILSYAEDCETTGVSG